MLLVFTKLCLSMCLPSSFGKTIFVVAVVEMPFRFGHSELGARLNKVADVGGDGQLVGLVILLGQHVVQERDHLALL